jgi:L-threonylcarbamoyladenylate synthase
VSDVVDATGDGRGEAVQAAAAALRASQLVVLPTDTVYGVGADAFDRGATRQVFRAKQRSRSFPLPVLVRSPKQVVGLVTRVPESAERLMAAYWPGPLTLVVARDPNLSWDLGDDEGTVALRMPMDEVTLEIIREVGPLAVTSANRSGRPPARTVDEARQALGDAVAVYVDGGVRSDAPPSTIVDLTRAEPHVLREGAVPGEQALAVATGDLAPHEVDLADSGGPAADDDLDDTTTG